MQDFDIVIIGAGVAGLTAAMTAGRYGARVAVIGEMNLGGQIMTATRIDNMPGLPQSVGGHELGPALHEQAEAAGAELMFDRVEAIERDGAHFVVRGAEEVLRARAVIIAAGSSLRILGVPGEAEFAGKGVSHCASCDGPLYRGKRLCVVGGGDAAFDEALVLAEFAARVTIVCAGEAPTAQKVLRDRAAAKSNIDVRVATAVTAITGAQTVAAVDIHDTQADTRGALEADGVFIYIGVTPNTGFLGALVNLDKTDHIVTDLMMRTSTSGVFAAGDIRAQSVAQLASVAGDGATAAVAAVRFLGIAAEIGR